MKGVEHDSRELALSLVARGTPRRSDRLVRKPSRDAVVGLVESAKRLLFPGHYAGTTQIGVEGVLSRFQEVLTEQVHIALAFGCDGAGSPGPLPARAREISAAFVRSLPRLQARLQTDVEAAYDGDPALYCRDEAVLCYPGIFAVICYRLAHALHALGTPLLPRMMTAHAHSVTGIDIHPAATIGERFFIDHGTGVVIGETTVIGDRVRIYQGVTLGAKSFAKDAEGKLVKGTPRHPILEDDVVVYSWSSILGRITIGRGSVIGSNVWVTHDVPPESLVTQAAPRDSLRPGTGHDRVSINGKMN